MLNELEVIVDHSLNENNVGKHFLLTDFLPEDILKALLKRLMELQRDATEEDFTSQFSPSSRYVKFLNDLKELVIKHKDKDIRGIWDEIQSETDIYNISGKLWGGLIWENLGMFSEINQMIEDYFNSLMRE